ncbi:MAG TPA: CRISPR-associated protein Csn1, partial [Rhodospirillum rubrum]|nr:CRISPR-associated protein Csn1 [Rhodospirillum rubrum]
MRPIEPWILGLDIGTDSLGWAVFSCEEKGPPTAKELLGGGVRLFDSGRDAKDHTSRQAERGAFRRARRQTRTWPWRRDRLIALFQAAGLTPPAAETRQIALALRREAVSRPLAPDALWAALLHLAHHRGFRSNRIDKRERAAAKALAKAKPAKATAKATAPAKEADDEAGFWEGAEAALRQRMAASGAPTVGALLADDLDRGQPVRMRYNQSDRDGVVAPTRALIAEELAEIVARQSSAYPGLDWPAVTRLVLDQRPLRSKGAGPCAFLPGEDRALRALPTVQDFIIRQTLANLRLPSTSADEPRPLTDEEHAKALALLSTARFVEWPALRRALGLKRGVKFTAETERNGAKQAARGTAGNLTEAILAPLIPGWSGWDLDRKDRVFSDLWAARQDRSALLALIGDPRGPTRVTEDETAEAVADAIQIVLPTGRASLSAKAARAIAQAMAPGIGYDEAVTLALGLHHSHRPRQERLARLPYYAAALPDVGLDGDPVGPPPAEDDGAAAEAYYGRIGNISVHIALNETRKIVNALLHRHGPILRLVMVETTRELKAGADERKRMIAEQAERERENAEIDVELRKSDRWMANARERRQRVRLARRQNNLCPYTSTPIGHADLLGDAYDIDHVIPLARGGRDSLDNMVLCQSDANKTKGDKTPWEAFHDKPGWIAQRDDFLARLDPQTAKALAWRFADDAGERVARKSAEDEDQGFLPRQLTDTGYIARVALRYLSLVTNEPNAVVATNGRLTGLLRLAWDITPGPAPRDLLPTPRDALRDDTAARRFLDGLTPPPLAKAVEGAVQARLAALGRSRVADAGLADALGLTLASLGGGGKNRADHRHHFIDAAMIAVTTRGLINQINQASGAGRILDLRKWPRTNFEPPYPTFRAEVMKQWDHIHPSIRPAHRDGGSLHLSL